MKPSTLFTPAVVPLIVLESRVTAGWKLLFQPSQPSWAMSRKLYTFEIACSLFSAYWTPCTYTPLELAAAQFAMFRLVTRLGSEAGSMIPETRRWLYFAWLRSDAITSMYCDS